jgi:DegV family protein with EDD domain
MVRIITDSSAYLPQHLVDQYRITVLPLSLIWDGKSYRDGVDILAADFYTRLKNANTMPTTSQVTEPQFTKAIETHLDEGESVLVLPMSAGISATHQSALQSVKLFPGKPIEIVDTRLVSMALSFMVLAAARAAEKGASLAECKATAEEAYKHIGVYFTVDSLKYLHKGGRIGGGKRWLGSALKIKPILQIQEGKIEAAGSAITRKKAIEQMIRMVEQDIAGRKPVRLSVFHALEPELAKTIQEDVNSRFHADEGIISEVSPAIGAHVGPGTISIAWMAGM